MPNWKSDSEALLQADRISSVKKAIAFLLPTSSDASSYALVTSISKKVKKS
jgi:hypothetical protein